MTKKKIRELTTLSAVDDLDLLAVVDIDEPVLENQTKKVTVSTLLAGVNVNIPPSNPYFVTNSTNALPVIDPTATSSVAIAGESVIGANSIQSIAIGNRATIGANAEGGIAIGEYAEITDNNEDAVAIGTFAYVRDSGNYGIAIGRFSDVSGNSGIAIGVGASTEGQDAIAIGNGTAGRADSSIAIGNNNGFTNTSVGSVSIGDTAGILGNSANSVLLGSNSNIRVNSFESISIGHNVTVFEGCNSSVSIGAQSNVGGAGVIATNAVAVGHTSQAKGNNAIALGSNSLADAQGCISIGGNAIASFDNSIALGFNSIATGANSIQFGTGTNAATNTLQFLTNRLANAEGLYTSFNTPTNYTPADNDNVTSHLRGIDTAFGLLSSETAYLDINSTGGLFADAQDTDGIAIGKGAFSVLGNGSVVIGRSARGSNSAVSIGLNASSSTTGITIGSGANQDGSSIRSINIGVNSYINASDAIAIGTSAVVSASAINSAQLSTGTNSTPNTLQFLTNRLANAEGLYTSFTSPSNYSPADNDNITSHLQAIDTALATAGGGDPGALVFGTARSTNFSIATTDHGINIPVTGTLIITLPNLASNTEVNIDLDVDNKIISYIAGAGATISAPSFTQSIQYTTVNCRFNSATSTWLLRGGLT